MPNGHTGGFVISRDELKQVLLTVSDTAIVGQRVVAGRGARLQPVSAAEAIRLVEELAYQAVNVEEQDGTFYIVHIGETYDTLMQVTSTSPIFLGLRQRHTIHAATHGRAR